MYTMGQNGQKFKSLPLGGQFQGGQLMAGGFKPLPLGGQFQNGQPMAGGFGNFGLPQNQQEIFNNFLKPRQGNLNTGFVARPNIQFSEANQNAFNKLAGRPVTSSWQAR